MQTTITRRIAVSGLAASGLLLLRGGAAVQAQTSGAGSPPAPPRISLEEFVKDSVRVDSLKRGVSAMKAREPSDPTSWFFQAAIHAVLPTWIEAAQRRDPKVAQVDQARFWNQCPHFGQSSADFLVWHRAYLYYFERILRDAAQDPSLSLPYWNYNDVSQRAFPSLFAAPDFDPVTQQPTNPLFDFRRENAFMAGVYELSEAAVSADDALRNTSFFGLTETTGFAGGVVDNSRNTKGPVEVRPHDQLHFAIGGAIGFGSTNDPDLVDDFRSGLMASVPTAAFDPVFWVHHCNIDRLWAFWDCAPGRVWGNVPPEDWFKAAPWQFHDYDRSVKTLDRASYMRHGGLGIRYDVGENSCRPLSATLPYEIQVAAAGPGSVAAAAESGNGIRRFAASRTEVIGRSDTQITLGATEPVSERISLAAAVLGDAQGAAAAIRKAAPETPRRVLLHLDGISYSQPPSVGYDVYVNLPDRVAPSRSSQHYAGSLSLFGTGDRTHGRNGVGKGHSAHHHGNDEGAGQQFDITSTLADTGNAIGELRVTIVPFDLLVPKAGGPQVPPPKRDGGVIVSRLKVIAVESRAVTQRGTP